MNDTYLIAIGRRIRSIRISAHLSQEELAEKLSISQKHISRCENGASCRQGCYAGEALRHASC